MSTELICPHCKKNNDATREEIDAFESGDEISIPRKCEYCNGAWNDNYKVKYVGQDIWY